MATLSSLLKTRSVSVTENNVVQGAISTFVPGALYTNLYGGFCWKAPGTGTAIIEMWGAGGSTAKGCCCGTSMPGNPGAYSKKTISVASGNFICGAIGRACNNADQLDFRGCSSPTQVCWTSTTTNGCMCAEGGRGGQSYCTTGTSPYCCFAANGHCATLIPNYCGIICNTASGWWIPNGYGGDVNCKGGISCQIFLSCWMCDYCSFQQYIAISPGMIGTDGAYVTINGQLGSSEHTGVVGHGKHALLGALGSMSKTLGPGMPFVACWGPGGGCDCYEAYSCDRNIPPGVPAPAVQYCSSVRSSGYTGGDGAVRIKFI